MTNTNLDLPAILASHALWLRGDSKGKRADLSGANLRSANLSGADLRSANLSGADLSGANLRSANLSGANLSGADLSSANLSGANLRSADLSGANLSGANLRSAENAELAQAQTIITPAGTLTGWKICKESVIVELTIPAAARRSNATGRKCRAEFVEVVAVHGADVGVSQHDGVTAYRAGETVRCGIWDDVRWNECSGGIHFFLTRTEAENYR